MGLPMTEQDERYIHFDACITTLNNAWRTLRLIDTQRANPLVDPAFRFCLVGYRKPYNPSYGVTKKFKLDTTFIPNQFLLLHKRIVDSRDQIHAHSDLTVMQAALTVHEVMGKRYTLIPQNYIHGTEEIGHLLEIVSLIEGTPDNMYVEQKVLKMALKT